jgi:hypothetical protein
MVAAPDQRSGRDRFGTPGDWFRDNGRPYVERVTTSCRQRGQASIETAALLPVLLLAALACWQAVLAAWTGVSAAHAARAAARAEMVGGAPLPAASAAVPRSMRGGLTVTDTDGRVRVTLHVPAVIPGLDVTLAADAEVVRQ